MGIERQRKCQLVSPEAESVGAFMCEVRHHTYDTQASQDGREAKHTSASGYLNLWTGPCDAQRSSKA